VSSNCFSEKLPQQELQDLAVSLANLIKFDSHARRRVYVPDLAFELALQHYQDQFAAVMESTITFRQLSLKAAHRNFPQVARQPEVGEYS